MFCHHKMDFLERMLPFCPPSSESMTVLDAHAGSGISSILWAEWLGQQGEVLAVEHRADTFQALQASTAHVAAVVTPVYLSLIHISEPTRPY